MKNLFKSAKYLDFTLFTELGYGQAKHSKRRHMEATLKKIAARRKKNKAARKARKRR